MTALVAGLGLFAGAAVAAPSVPSDDDIAAVDAAADDTAAQITALEAELAGNQAAYDAAQLDAAVAAEDYNAAVVALDDAEAEQEAADQAADEAQVELDAASVAMAELAMASYRSGGDLAQLSSLLSADGLEDALEEAATYQVLGTSTAATEQRYAEAEVAATVANDRAADAVVERTAAAADLEDAKAEADATAAEATEILAANTSRHDELVVQLADLRQTSVEMEEQRQAAAEQARLDAENDAAAAAVGVAEPAAVEQDQSASPEPSEDAAEPTSEAAPSSRPTQDPTPEATTTTSRPTQDPKPSTTTTTKPKPKPKPPTAPPSTSANAAALAWAKTQLGKPYVYGAAGPNSYDCSGLTMMAYANAGITISRTSKSQYYSGDLVPVGQMKPGDLFFYSSNGSPSGIYHVAIYAGNGMRLHAPSAGKNVELVSMWWPNVLPYAVRP